MTKKKSSNNSLLYILPLLLLVGYFGGQRLKKLLPVGSPNIEEEVFPIVRENISEDLKLVVEPDYVDVKDGMITVYLKQDTSSSVSPEVTKSREFIKTYLQSKLETWKNSSEYQAQEIQVKFNDE